MTPQRRLFTSEWAERNDLKNLNLSTDWGQLNCLGEIKGLGNYEVCRAQSEGVDLDGTEVRLLTLNALNTAKLAMGHPWDLHAVLEPISQSPVFPNRKDKTQAEVATKNQSDQTKNRHTAHLGGKSS